MPAFLERCSSPRTLLGFVGRMGECAFSGACGSAEHLTSITSSRSQTYKLLKFVGEDLLVLSLYVFALRRRKRSEKRVLAFIKPP